MDASAKSEDQILVQLLLFSDKNFRNRCLLRDAAATIGYDYAYISKLFKRKVGISFRQYVNNLRIIESKPLLTAGDKSIEEIARDTDRDNFMTAEQALEYGLIDKIYTHRD